MATQTFTINTVLPGWGTSEYFYKQGQFLNSLGIDPEMPATTSSTKPSGLIRPTAMEKFSASEITGVPMWMETNNKNTNTYVYASDGKVHVVDEDLAMDTPVTTITSSSGNGLVYYNNYLYLAKDADVARYGPLSNSPSVVQNFWTSTLSLTPLQNKTYPVIKGVEMPNHSMFVHPKNNRLYFCDVDANNIGIVSMIKTKKSTYEGEIDDTVVPSAYKVLDFYYNLYPTTLCNLGTELVVGLINGTNTDIKQGNAQVAFWSTLASDTLYNRIVTLPDPLITALKNVNGVLYAFTGNASGGMRLSRYIGGETFEELYYSDDQAPPLAGAVDYMINRIVWGASTTTPATSACVMAIGSRIRDLGMGVQNILKSTSGGTTPLVTALKYVTLGANAQPIIGWSDGTGKGLDKVSTAYKTNIWRSQVFSLGRNGQIKRIRIPFAQEIAANMTLTVKLYLDDGSSNTTVKVISNTTHSGKRDVVLYPNGVNFKNNFYLELTWSGSALLTVATPITLDVNYSDE